MSTATKPFLTAPSQPMWAREILVVPFVTPVLDDLVNGRSVCIVAPTLSRAAFASDRVAAKLAMRGVTVKQANVLGRPRVTVIDPPGGVAMFFAIGGVETTLRGYQFDTALILAPSAKFEEYNLGPVCRVLRSQLRPR